MTKNITMLEIFEYGLKDFPINLEIVSVKETNDKYKLTLKYGDDTDNVELRKTCAPGCERDVCWMAASTAMSTIYLKRGDFTKAKLWLDATHNKKIITPENA